MWDSIIHPHDLTFLACDGDFDSLQPLVAALLEYHLLADRHAEEGIVDLRRELRRVDDRVISIGGRPRRPEGDQAGKQRASGGQGGILEHFIFPL